MRTLLCFVVFVSASSLLRAQPVIVPPGYVVNEYHDANDPNTNFTGISIDATGRVYLCSLTGVVTLLEDTDGDGDADVVGTFWDGTSHVASDCVGVLVVGNAVLVSHRGVITRLVDTDGDDVADVVTDIVTGLPNGWHANNQLFTDGTHVYFGLGSETDHAVDPDPRSATLMRMNPDGTNQVIFATGLRNVYDGVVHPAHGDIFVADNGPNLVPGNPSPPEEVNLVVQNGDYGHPQNWGTPPAGSTAIAPVALLPAHGSPCGMAVNPNTMLSGHRNEMVATLWTNQGGSVVRLPTHYGALTGQAGVWFEPWATAMISPIDLAFLPDGSLLLVDYGESKIWRVASEGDVTVTVETPPAIGSTCDITITAPSFSGETLYISASHGLSASPVVIGGASIHVDLTSALWALSTTPGNPFFAFPHPGPLDGAGGATAQIFVPNDPALIGFQVQIQALAVSAAGGFSASPAVQLFVLPSW